MWSPSVSRLPCCDAEQGVAVAHRRVGGDLRPDQVGFEDPRLAAEHDRQPRERVQVIVDDGLARDRELPAVLDEAVLFLALADRAEGVLAVLLDFEERGRVAELQTLDRLVVRQRAAAGERRPGLGLLVVRLAQRLVRHVGEQVGEVRRRVHPAAVREAEGLRRELVLRHVRDADAARLQVGAADVEQGHAAVEAAAVGELEVRRRHAVQERFLDASAHVHDGAVDAEGDIGAGPSAAVRRRRRRASGSLRGSATRLDQRHLVSISRFMISAGILAAEQPSMMPRMRVRSASAPRSASVGSVCAGSVRVTAAVGAPGSSGSRSTIVSERFCSSAIFVSSGVAGGSSARVMSEH
jgi:hypothetical protein